MNIYAAGFYCAKSAWKGILNPLSDMLKLADSLSERSAFWKQLLWLHTLLCKIIFYNSMIYDIFHRLYVIHLALIAYFFALIAYFFILCM